MNPITFKFACPHNFVTGGVELIHQVVAELNKQANAKAYIWHIADSRAMDIPEAYLCYGIRVNNTVESDDVLIFPEIWAQYTLDPRYAHNRKCVFWEGVNAYFVHTPKDMWYRFGEGTLHISQSDYSERFIRDVLRFDNIIEIGDYVHDDFLGSDTSKSRDPVVLYNPARDTWLLDKVIRYAPDGIRFIPIQGMTRSQIVDLMTRSMVFIDFGDFPGKDRLPREAGACGMCLITSKRGSARFSKDLDIPEAYKIADVNYSDIRKIVTLIMDIIENFEEHQKRFAGYRKRLQQEKTDFAKGIIELVRNYEV